MNLFQQIMGLARAYPLITISTMLLNYLMTNNITIFLLEFVIVFFNFYRLKIKFEKNEISEDIFFYVVKDKFLITSSILSLGLLIFGV